MKEADLIRRNPKQDHVLEIMGQLGSPVLIPKSSLKVHVLSLPGHGNYFYDLWLNAVKQKHGDA